MADWSISGDRERIVSSKPRIYLFSPYYSFLFPHSFSLCPPFLFYPPHFTLFTTFSFYFTPPSLLDILFSSLFLFLLYENIFSFPFFSFFFFSHLSFIHLIFLLLDSNPSLHTIFHYLFSISATLHHKYIITASH